MRKSHFYAWVIKSKRKTKKPFTFIGGKTDYFAQRTSLKNPRFMTNLHWQVKLFSTKEEATDYFLAKVRAMPHSRSLEDCVVRRMKFFLDKRGQWDYWKNREVLHK